MALIRSMLFAPGNNKKVMIKALAAGADAVIFDLEDAVAVSVKAEARQQIEQVISEVTDKGCQVFVRINSWDSQWGKDDLKYLQHLDIQGIVLPKAQEAAQLDQVAEKLPENMELVPLVETAKGVMNACAIASVAKVSRLAFGAIDFTLDIGTSFSKTGKELLYARSNLVIASKAAGIEPPVDTVFHDLNDAEGLKADVEEAKLLGMFGKLLIHPKQIPMVHEAFSPTSEEIDYANKVVAAFAEAEEKGIAAVQVDGKMVDYPVVARAKKVLDLAKSIGL